MIKMLIIIIRRGEELSIDWVADVSGSLLD